MSAEPPATSNTNETTTTAADGGDVVVAGGIRSLRKMRGSVPVSAEVFTSTSNPLVIAFQVSVVFAAERGEELSWPGLQRRWAASRRGAAEARRVLIDLGYWAEVRARQSDGRFRTETRTWEARMTEDDLIGLASEYAPSSVIHCGGRTYTVSPDGLVASAREIFAGHRVTDSGNSVRPAETSVTTVTDIPELVPRSDLRIVDNSPTDIPELVTRSDLRKQDEPAGRTDLPKLVGQHHGSSSLEEEQTCMHDDFWAKIGQLVSSTQVDPPGRRAVHDQLAVAFQAGWKPKSLARWLAGQVQSAKRLSNPAGFMIARLREIPAPADVPPTRRELEDQRAAEARQQAQERKRERDACDLCGEDGFVPGTQIRCDHDTSRARQTAESVSRGAALLAEVRAARRAGRGGSGQPGRSDGARAHGRSSR